MEWGSEKEKKKRREKHGYIDTTVGQTQPRPHNQKFLISDTHSSTCLNSMMVYHQKEQSLICPSSNCNWLSTTSACIVRLINWTLSKSNKWLWNTIQNLWCIVHALSLFLQFLPISLPPPQTSPPSPITSRGDERKKMHQEVVWVSHCWMPGEMQRQTYRPTSISKMSTPSVQKSTA